jgi:acyl carrier protein
MAIAQRHPGPVMRANPEASDAADVLEPLLDPLFDTAQRRRTGALRSSSGSPGSPASSARLVERLSDRQRHPHGLGHRWRRRNRRTAARGHPERSASILIRSRDEWSSPDRLPPFEAPEVDQCPLRPTWNSPPMTRQEVIDLMRDRLSDILEIEPDEISEGDSFADDLDADSLALIELVEALEEELGERTVGLSHRRRGPPGSQVGPRRRRLRLQQGSGTGPDLDGRVRRISRERLGHFFVETNRC